ncbi:MAG: ABC transporter substrate-binding protein, partial [Desulfobacteraceae bacterium]
MEKTGRGKNGLPWFPKAAGWFFCLLFLLLTPHWATASDGVVLQLAWKHQFQFAGYYAALHRGLYQKAGLDVTIVEGGEGKFAREELLSGGAQYGVAGAELILHRMEGDPFVVMAPIFQHSPSVLLARKDSGISSLQDLIGKRVMLLPGKKDADILAAFVNEGIDLEAIHRLDQTYDLEDLIQKKTDAVSAYITNEPWLLSRMGIEPQIISPLTYGVDFYADCLFTTEQEIEKHPERVQLFLDASLEGWEYAMAHPGEIIDLLVTEYGVKKSRDHLRYEAEAIRELMFPDLVQIGHMNPGRWRHIAETYAKIGLMDGDYSLEGFLYDPNPEFDYTWLKWAAGISLALVLILGGGTLVLFGYNRRLAGEIADRRAAEEQLRQSEWEKRRAQKLAADHEKYALVGQIAGKMAHDFNNILAGIMGTAQLELIKETDEKRQEILELIVEQTMRGKNLTRNLVAFAKDQEPKQVWFSVNGKIDLVLRLLKKDLDGIDIVREYSFGLPELLADPGMVEHGLVNVIQNAIHATGKSTHPMITIRTAHREGHIFIEIIDNGCGIPEACMEKVYQPSFTLKGSKDTTGSYKNGIKGTGYGLANVKKYVEQHQGTIAIASQQDRGTTVTITFPAMKKP